LGKNTLKKSFYLFGIAACLVVLIGINFPELGRFNPFRLLSPLTQTDKEYEVFGFAPYWNFGRLDNVNFATLSTFAYFGIEIDEKGRMVKDDPGYTTFHSERATEVFKKAHAYGTRVVLTITMMDNENIEEFLKSPQAQERTIKETVDLVDARGIDGINVDFEYLGDPGEENRKAFTSFVERITDEMHKRNQYSKVTVSVYAASAKYTKMYEIKELADGSDGIFMMAYDFATTSSDIAIPTAPLNGHREGKYWYDISTAVDDFLAVMPADKLILGVPYYGYNYLVGSPEIKAETLPSYYFWNEAPEAQTYTDIKDDINPGMEGVSDYREGWDDLGKVSWKAYYIDELETWRMVFIEDEKSLSLKYDLAKSKGLAGVGMWALGMDNGKTELWDLLAQKFGKKLADRRVEN
jgi:spore germination protein